MCSRTSATTPRSGAISRPPTSCGPSPTSNSSGTRRPAATTARTSTESTTRDRTRDRQPAPVRRRWGSYAILNPLTRGNIADYLLNSRICAAVNDWLLDRWLEPDTTNRFRGTIRVNPEDPKGAVAEIERLADHPKLVQVGVPMQSREPYGKPIFEPIWEAAAAHGLPVAVHINGGNGVDHPPTFAGHAHTYPGYAAFMPLNYFVHLATLIVEGVFGRHPGLKFVFADGGYDILTPLMWRLDTFWLSMRDQTPWVDRYPSEYLPGHVRFCSSAFDGPTDAAHADARWMDFSGKADLLMYGSGYPHWSTSSPDRGRGPRRRATAKSSMAERQ